MWRKVNVIFKLKSPLHIGYLPFKGSVVSPTRYYVPGRSLWGAVTKRITEYLFKPSPKEEDYRNIGKQIIENFRFSYFYIYDGETIYIPKFEGYRIKYGNIDRSEFENKFIGSRISTAIDPYSLTAKNESIHEIEFINEKFCDIDGDLKDVKIAGCIWIREDTKINGKEAEINRGIIIDDFNVTHELIIGGEAKYGFGHVFLESINKINTKIPPFIWETPEEIEQDEFIISHLKYDKSIKFEGDLELLSGRGYYDPKVIDNSESNISNAPGRIISRPEYYLSPGSRILPENKRYILKWDGTLEVESGSVKKLV